MIRLVHAAAALILLALPVRAAVEVQEITTPGGIDLWLVEEHAIPFVALEIMFRGGTSLDAPGKRGAVNLMTALLEEGAGDMDASAFAEATENLAAGYQFSANDDSVSISARFLTENRDAAADLLRAALSEPRFDAGAVERVRGQVLAELRSDLQDPAAISGRKFRELAFGDHPYGSSGEGTIDSVAALTRDDIFAAHRAALARDRLVVAAVGDISAHDLSALIDRLFAGLPETGAPIPGRAEFLMKGGVTTVPFDTPQSVITFGQKGLKRDDPDFFPAFVMTEILGGGGFTARLMTEVREKRGLTYGISANLVPKDHGEMLVGRVATANATAGETIEVIRDEWAKLASEGVTANELAAAQTYLTGAYPLRFDGNARIASILAGMQADDLPVSYLQTRNDKINAVTLEDIRRVAAELIRPNDLHFVVVGQPDGLMPGN
jgi:zinc protease